MDQDSHPVFEVNDDRQEGYLSQGVKSLLKGLGIGLVIAGLLRYTWLGEYALELVLFLSGFTVAYAWQSYRRVLDMSNHQDTIRELMIVAAMLNGMAEAAAENDFLEEASERAQEHRSVIRNLIRDMDNDVPGWELKKKYGEFFEERRDYSEKHTPDGEGDDSTIGYQ